MLTQATEHLEIETATSQWYVGSQICSSFQISFHGCVVDS